MQDTLVMKQMTPAQQEQLIRMFGVGLRWASGEISFDDVMRSLGKPSRFYPDAPDAGSDTSEYSYFLEGMTVDLIFDKTRLVDGNPAVDRLRIEVAENVQTNIPKESYEDRLKLHRLVVGESIDGVRTETGPYFVPDGIVAMTDPNLVSFGYRQLLPPESLYDVYTVVTYLGQFNHDGPEFRSLQHPLNLRGIQINRVYLTPEQLEQRRLAKRQKYGMMNLRTGMLCPETGIWESWTETGPSDQMLVWAGQTFGRVFTIPRRIQSWSPMVDGRWMWAQAYEPMDIKPV
jgi:hypothetical protein